MRDLVERAIEMVATGEPTDADDISRKVAAAALEQFELFGIERSTMDDIARRAGVARVTVYRRYPTKEALIDAVVVGELLGYLEALDAALEPFPVAEDQLIEGFIFTLKAVRAHRLLQRLLTTEPESLIPHLTTEGAPILAVGREFLAHRLYAEFAGRRTLDDLRVVADLAARLLISYAITPSDLVDLDDQETARRFADAFLRPILEVEATWDPASHRTFG